MSKPNMECRVCGKPYFCCIDSKKMGAWKSMSCSPECYKTYMKRIEESRKPSFPNVTATEKPIVKKRKSELKIKSDIINNED